MRFVLDIVFKGMAIMSFLIIFTLIVVPCITLILILGFLFLGLVSVKDLDQMLLNWVEKIVHIVSKPLWNFITKSSQLSLRGE